MGRLDWTIAMICALVALASVGLTGVRAMHDPMQVRLTAFEHELATISYVPEKLTVESDVNYKALVVRISRKKNLWRELIPPPPIRPTPKARPDLKKMLQGVVASKRQEIGRGDTIQIKIKTPTDNRGRWMGVGEKINGLTIAAIESDYVLFSFKQRGEKFTYKLPRR